MISIGSESTFKLKLYFWPVIIVLSSVETSWPRATSHRDFERASAERRTHFFLSFFWEKSKILPDPSSLLHHHVKCILKHDFSLTPSHSRSSPFPSSSRPSGMAASSLPQQQRSPDRRGSMWNGRPSSTLSPPTPTTQPSSFFFCKCLPDWSATPPADSHCRLRFGPCALYLPPFSLNRPITA